MAKSPFSGRIGANPKAGGTVGGVHATKHFSESTIQPLAPTSFR
jgi:hypothetical protein